MCQLFQLNFLIHRVELMENIKILNSLVWIEELKNKNYRNYFNLNKILCQYNFILIFCMPIGAYIINVKCKVKNNVFIVKQKKKKLLNVPVGRTLRWNLLNRQSFEKFNRFILKFINYTKEYSFWAFLKFNLKINFYDFIYYWFICKKDWKFLWENPNINRINIQKLIKYFLSWPFYPGIMEFLQFFYRFDLSFINMIELFMRSDYKFMGKVTGWVWKGLHFCYWISSL